ncbi:hypothetical protein M1271_03220 [Patescibacteria group bacterium]|nr:hypothetical protein [Patescibacteria group bacterium]MCL5797313.1 hypothetical protein [Patescibacteria group bacterium]
METQSANPSPTPNIPQDAPSNPPQETPVATAQNPAKPRNQKHIYIILALIVLILFVAGSYTLMMSGKKTQTTVNPQPTSLPVAVYPTAITTPAVTPITSSNVDQTLNNTDTTMQQAINQTDTDLNSINNIDKSQDSTNGL